MTQIERLRFPDPYKFPRLPVSFPTSFPMYLADNGNLCYDKRDAGFSITSAIILTKAMLRGMQIRCRAALLLL